MPGGAVLAHFLRNFLLLVTSFFYQSSPSSLDKRAERTQKSVRRTDPRW